MFPVLNILTCKVELLYMTSKYSSCTKETVIADLDCISGALVTFIFIIMYKCELMTLYNNYVEHYPLSKVYEIYITFWELPLVPSIGKG